jgi:PAS domain S-box-containing protein
MTTMNEKSSNPEANGALYQKMINEVQDYAILMLDQNGIIRNWNKGAQQIKQYIEAEVVGMHFQMFYLPEDRNSGLPEKLLNEARVNGRAVHEGWRLRKDGSRFWGSIALTALHDDQGAVIGFSKVTRDLTDKKLADDQLKKYAEELQHTNEALRKSEERYHKMIDEVRDYAILLLDKDGNIQNWNTGAEAIKGYKPDEIIGKNFRTFYLPEDRAGKLPEKLLQEATDYGKAIHEGWRLRKDGSRFWGSIVITALHAVDGSIIGFSKLTRDLTERKQAEDIMREYLLQLEKQNKELEQMTYVVSHDLQEPLRKIQMFTDITSTFCPDQMIVQRYLQKINVSAERMRALISSILSYTSLIQDEDKMEVTDLDAILRSVLADFELPVEEKNAQIESDVLPVIKAIPSQVDQLFYNLISNALKFTDKPPRIRISSTILQHNEIESVTDHFLKGTYLQITFADNGIGFDNKYENLIYAMFQRLHGKHEYSGTGIGLTLCKKIMENHHGFIRANGEPGKGATFYLYFPVNP